MLAPWKKKKKKKLCSLVRSGIYFDQIVSWKIPWKLTYFYLKNNYYIGTRLLYRALIAPGEIFENMLQLTCFGLYFEGVLNRKWLLSYRNSDISYTEMLGGSGHAPSENFEIIDAI